MPKLFAADCDLSAESILLTGENADHLRVLRVRPGEQLMISDGRGMEALCAVDLAGKDGCRLRVLERMAATGEATVSAAVYAAFPKGDKAEVIVQKSVELGAGSIVFFLSSRCIARPDEKAAKSKMERLNKISQAAAEQSGRGMIPPVRWIPGFGSAFLWEDADGYSLKKQLQSAASFRTAALITGPEGGFSQEEAQMARDAGIPAVTLGRRILRCETAPLCALTALMYESGNLE